MYHVDHDLQIKSCRSPQSHNTAFAQFPHFGKREDAAAYASRETRKRERAKASKLQENDTNLALARQELVLNPHQLSGERADVALSYLAHWYSARELYGVLTDADEILYQRLGEEIIAAFRTYLEDRYRTSKFSQAQLDLLYAQADRGRGVLKLEKRYREYAAFAKSFATAR
jgi:hypothetical protein